MQLDEKHLSFLNQGQTSDFIQFRLEFKLEFERLVSSITRLKTLETRILSRIVSRYKSLQVKQRLKNSVIRRFRNERRIDGRKVGEQSVVKAELGRGGGRVERRWGARRVVCGEGGGERREESTPKIGSNKLSTIFAGLNTLKRLEIRLGGGPFVHGAPCRPGMKDCNVLSRKRDENRVQLSKPGSRTVFRDSPPTLTKIYIHI